MCGMKLGVDVGRIQIQKGFISFVRIFVFFREVMEIYWGIFKYGGNIY